MSTCLFSVWQYIHWWHLRMQGAIECLYVCMCVCECKKSKWVNLTLSSFHNEHLSFYLSKPCVLVFRCVCVFVCVGRLWLWWGGGEANSILTMLRVGGKRRLQPILQQLNMADSLSLWSAAADAAAPPPLSHCLSLLSSVFPSPCTYSYSFFRWTCLLLSSSCTPHDLVSCSVMLSWGCSLWLLLP